jgi:pyruvate dehydrogenase E2 component (dihydrolipoamide acetyltransferase)
MTTEIKLPELGENIDVAQVLSVLVSVGDRVEKDQPVIELETDKATAEVPAEASGVVKEVLVKEGDEIKVGQTILSLESESAEAEPAGNGEGSRGEPRTVAAPPAPAPRPPVKETREERPAEKVEVVKEKPEALDEVRAPETPPPAPVPRPEARVAPPGVPAPAAPSVRRRARELGLDIHQVAGTGPGGRISREDVLAAARAVIGREQPALGGAPRTAGPALPDLPDFTVYGEVEREPADRVRKLTAQTMSLSWRTIPHVTQHDRADITNLEEWRKSMAPKVEKTGGKLTVTAIAVRIVASALKVFPKFNASFDEKNEEIVYKKYVNVGVAVDTERGLLVPVVRNADQKNLTELSMEVSTLARKAREKTIRADQLQGANINISNLGGLGTTTFSPIVAWPQVAVVGIGRAETQGSSSPVSSSPSPSPTTTG